MKKDESLYDKFYHHYSLSGLSLAAGRILFRHQVLMLISFFFYNVDAQQFSARKPLRTLRTFGEHIIIAPRHEKMCIREFPTRSDSNWPAQLQKLLES